MPPPPPLRRRHHLHATAAVAAAATTPPPPPLPPPCRHHRHHRHNHHVAAATTSTATITTTMPPPPPPPPRHATIAAATTITTAATTTSPPQLTVVNTKINSVNTRINTVNCGGGGGGGMVVVVVVVVVVVMVECYYSTWAIDFLTSSNPLLLFACAIRSERPEVDAVMVEKDAKDLFKDGEWRYGTDEETFIRIFSERSCAHLAAINSAYRKLYVNSLKKAVKRETSSKLKSALLTILRCAENPGKYFAKALHKSMDGLGTDDETLTRIIVSRAEVDIERIKAEYLKKYGKSLSDDVHSDTSGQYRAFLLLLLTPNA
ncbi:hypothetical protein RHGRI_024158 [Rhododendron griersonianum]|uniref:Annexin n=1 Tax=Rhododendron griersonianum TaxID=479676 RepID=A0AAV6J6G6_9ERIC|nr:hypothetical protein RHGRI_024158 [Rhododendron griersonianum]